MAIIEYLDEVHPQPPLLPSDALGRARVRALAQSIACEIHPLNNLRVLKYLAQKVTFATPLQAALLLETNPPASPRDFFHGR